MQDGQRFRADIIDNIQNSITMQMILNSEIPYIKQFDVSTGYFDVQGYGMLRQALEESTKDKSFVMRLLLGKEALIPAEDSFEKYAQQYKESQNNDEKVLSLKVSLDESEFTQESRTDTTSLIALLNQQNIQVRLGTSRFNHSKCYILGNDSVFIGSSNLTCGGLIGNYELNAGLYQPGAITQTREWFEKMWEKADDTKDDLISVLMQSKFGAPPEPFVIYMKMLFERFKPLLAERELDTKGSATLTKFQQDAVRTGMFIISEYGGTMIADSTGLGKTNMGIEIVRQKVLKEGKKVLLIAPSQVLYGMWEEKLKDVDIHLREMLTMESLGRDAILDDLGKYRNIDFVIIDESQNFRSKNANRRKNLMKLMSVGKPKQTLLLSATPINNSLMDLYYQLSIITGGDDSYFYKTIGIPNLYSHMRDAANREGLQQGLDKIQQLLDNVMIRRTRSYIKEVYKDDKINGDQIKFPKHEYSPIKYKMSNLFGNIFEKLLDQINSLSMAPYGIEQYNNDLDDKEKQKHKVRAHLQIILLLKRFESSVEAVKISLGNKITMYTYVRKILDEGKILRVRDFNKIITKWNASEDGSDPEWDTDEKEKAGFFIEEIKKIEKEHASKNYDIERLKKDMDDDLQKLNNLLEEIKNVTIDTKLDAVIHTILEEKALDKDSKKVLIFTEYTATAKYITRCFKEKIRNKNIQCITGNTSQDTRKQYIRRFAPNANLLEDEKLEHDEIDILVSTEVLSEGQNLQDCNYVINYDLPWNPMRIVQRTGRVDRLTSTYDTIHSRACYPEDELDKLLKLVGRLIEKIEVVNSTVGLDAEVLGEIPRPKQFNGSIKQRIQVLAGKDSESDKIIEDMERESDIMPQTSPINELGRYIKEKGIEFMKDIPMGRRSGKTGEEQKAVLAYLEEKPERRVYFVLYDFKRDKAHVPDDDFEAIRVISCDVNTPIHLPMDGSDNQESFELLLQIDHKARAAIKEKNNTVLQYVKDLKKDRKQQHEKNISLIKQAITTGVSSGDITTVDGESIMDIIKSEYLRPWDDTLNDLLSEYQRSKDSGTLVTGIKKMGQYIGLENKPKSQEPVEDNTNLDLKLVGAMFVMDTKIDHNTHSILE